MRSMLSSSGKHIRNTHTPLNKRCARCHIVDFILLLEMSYCSCHTSGAPTSKNAQINLHTAFLSRKLSSLILTRNRVRLVQREENHHDSEKYPSRCSFQITCSRGKYIKAAVVHTFGDVFCTNLWWNGQIRVRGVWGAALQAALCDGRTPQHQGRSLRAQGE
jgi:hypothetical protein